MVELVRQNYSANKKLYKRVYDKLLVEFGKNVPINHVGSTAIPNMYGKNIIDILVGVNNFEQMEEFTNKLTSIGFFGSKRNKKEDIYRFFASTEEETKSGDVHIHLVFIDTDRYNDFITLKNYLLKNKEETKKYSEFKKNILKNTIGERKEYKSIKSEYVSVLLNRARKTMNK